MISIEKSLKSFNTFIAALRVALAARVKQQIEKQLEADVAACNWSFTMAVRVSLNLLDPLLPHQRCLFHKLRNLRSAIQPAPHMTRDELRPFKHDLMQHLPTIFAAPSPQAMKRQRDDFVRHWPTQQPALAATLCRDWAETVAFFRVLARFPNWSRSFLRTTRWLERVNRMIRRLFRAAGAFHSPTGLLAAATRGLEPYRLT